MKAVQFHAGFLRAFAAARDVHSGIRADVGR